MRNVIINPEKIAKALLQETRTATIARASQFIQNLAKTLIASGRGSTLKSVLRAYRKQLIRANQLPEIKIVSAHALSEREKKDITKAMGARGAAIVAVEREGLIGGADVRYQGSAWNFSVREKLRKLKRQAEG